MHAHESIQAWQRISEARLRLKPYVQFHAHQYRGQTGYVLHDPVSGSNYRIGSGAHALLSMLDGSRPVGVIYDELCHRSGTSAPSQADIVRLLARLHDSSLLLGSDIDDGDGLVQRHRRLQRSRRIQRWLNPLSIRIRLLDPDRFLSLIRPYIRPLFGRYGLSVWCLLVCSAVVLAATHYPELSAHFDRHALDTGNIMLMLILYPLIKALHEFGHAATIKHWGGEVHEMGVMFLVAIPLPYVDGSAASTFSSKWQRVAVGAAGVMSEMMIAAIGMLVWLEVEPGLINNIAFDVMLIGGISTVLFNGNPLLRYDGYYILADLIEIPNLDARARGYLGSLFKRHICRIDTLPIPEPAYGEAGWLLGYGLAASLYRFFISLAIALYIAGKFFFIGVILAGWVIAGRLVYPALKHAITLYSDPGLAGHRKRALITTTALFLLMAGGILAIPLPAWTQAQGVLRMPEHSHVRANGDGFIVRAYKKEGQTVSAGEPLFVMENPFIAASRNILESKLAELRAKQTAVFMRDRTQVEILQHEIDAVSSEFDEVNTQIQDQIVRSMINGIYLSASNLDPLGSFVEKGDLLGYVSSDTTMSAQVIVQQKDIDQVRRYTKNVELRLPYHPGFSVEGRISRETPMITSQLPSKALGSQGGGAISVDARDQSGLRTLAGVYQLNIDLLDRAVPCFAGSRVYVRFNHPPETLAARWERSLRQLFLSRLAV